MATPNMHPGVETAPARAALELSASTPAAQAMALAEINQKLDRLGQQVGHLYQRTVALEELKDELTRIARDGLAALTVELGAVEHEFNSEEIQHLLRKGLRATPRLIRLLDLLESADGFMLEAGPLGKEMLKDLSGKLQQAEENGTFRLARGGLDLVNRISEHYEQEDLDKLSENVVFILDTVKRMTQPEMLSTLNHAIDASHQDAKPLGLFGLVGALRDPEVQQGLGVLVSVLRNVAGANSGANNPPRKGSLTSETR